MMRYGVVGVGYFGADLARFMNEFDDAQITMVYDPENGETIAQELQCVAAKSLRRVSYFTRCGLRDCGYSKLLTQRTGNSCSEKQKTRFL